MKCLSLHEGEPGHHFQVRSHTLCRSSLSATNSSFCVTWCQFIFVHYIWGWFNWTILFFFFSLGLWKFTVFTCTLMVSILNWKRLMFLVNIYMIFCERKYDEPYSMFTGHVRHWNERCARISEEHGRHAVCPGSQSLRNQYCVRWGKVHTWDMTVRRQKQRALVDHVGGWGGRSTGVQKTHGRCRYLPDSQSLWHAHGLRWGSASRFGDVLLHVFFVQKQWGVRVDPVRVCR